MLRALFQLGAWPLPVQEVLDNLRVAIPTSQQDTSSSTSAGWVMGEAPLYRPCLSSWTEPAEAKLEAQLWE